MPILRPNLIQRRRARYQKVVQLL
nr:unnamed protein product [Callosobruchus analis]CAI5850580.1 unnamed protein product [Callosobruchus analis]